MSFTKNKILEWSGAITAIIYSVLVAMNIGAEFIGYLLLLISAILIGLWSYFESIKESYYYKYFMPQQGFLE